MHSPIDLNDEQCVNMEFEPFNFGEFTKKVTADVVNNGERIQLTFTPETMPHVCGAGLPNIDYVVHDMHFVWDSEHTINQNRYSLECHVVLFCNECETFETALKQRGVSVLATLYKISDKDNPGINQLLPLIPQIREQHDSPVRIKDLNLAYFLPRNCHNFYRYTGSLTTAPYTKNIMWTVFNERLPITRRQITTLVDIFDKKGHLIVHNNRKLKILRNQELFFNGGEKDPCKCTKKCGKTKKGKCNHMM